MTKTMTAPRSGYTLPVFACASAIAALRHLLGENVGKTVSVDLIEPEGIAEIPIEQVAKTAENSALAFCRSDPGDNLDLTRHTPIWAWVQLLPPIPSGEPIILIGGEGIGKHRDRWGEAAIYRYARQLFQENLKNLLSPHHHLAVTLILPEGRQLAKRTSNEAFGVVEGLSLLGTTGISQPLTALGQLEQYQEILHQKAQRYDSLVFCVGENGVDLGQRLGIGGDRLVKTANWLGSMLVYAAQEGITSILLFGYHGKLIKLAGGIFHTHHHLADGRLEILTAHGVKIGLPLDQLQILLSQPTTEAALSQLRQWDKAENTDWVNQLYQSLTTTIDHRSQAYIYTQIEKKIEIGSILFDRDRQIIALSPTAQRLFPHLQSN